MKLPKCTMAGTWRLLKAFLLWLVRPLPAQVRGFLLTLVLGAILYACLSFAYSQLPLFSGDDEADILARLEKDPSTDVSKLRTESALIVATSDSDMLSFDFCVSDEAGRPPTLQVYSESRALIPSILDFVFQRDGSENLELTSSVEFENPDKQIRIFVVDDVRFVDEERAVLSVLLSSYGCGSAGLKYMGFFELRDGHLEFLGQPPLKAFYVGKPGAAHSLVPRHPLTASVGPGIGFATYSLEDAVFYDDIDNDGDEELVEAFMLWAEQDECHWCPHQWVISVLERGPYGYHPSREFCGGLTVISGESYTPQAMNGFIPETVGLFGQIHPASLQSRNRFTEGSVGIVRSILRQDGVCDEYAEYFTDTPSLLNFVEVETERLDPDLWTGDVESLQR